MFDSNDEESRGEGVGNSGTARRSTIDMMRLIDEVCSPPLKSDQGS